MLTCMAPLLTRMARMLTRMTRWLAGSHIIHTRYIHVCTLRAHFSFLHMAFSICEVFAWLVCPVVGLLGLANDFAMLKNHAREEPLLAGYVMYVE